MESLDFPDLEGRLCRNLIRVASAVVNFLKVANIAIL